MENKKYYLEIVTSEKTWEEKFDPGKRTNKEILESIQTFLDAEINADKVTIRVHMPKEEHPAVVE